MGFFFKQKDNGKTIKITYNCFINIQCILFATIRNLSISDAKNIFKHEFESKILPDKNIPFYFLFSICRENGEFSIEDLSSFLNDFNVYQKEIYHIFEKEIGVHYQSDILFKPFFDFLIDGCNKKTKILFF